MKRILIILTCAIFAHISKGQTKDDLDIKNGYKDIRLQSSFDSLKKEIKFKTGMFKMEDEDYKFYWIADKNYQSFSKFKIGVAVGNYKKQNKIGQIVLSSMFSSINQFLEMRDFFKAQYGEPDIKRDTLPMTGIWKGKRVSLTMILNEDLSLNVFITDNYIQQLVDADKKERFRKEGKEF